MDNVHMDHGDEDNNYDHVDRQVYKAHQMRQQKRSYINDDSEVLDEVIEVEVINKRVIGKVMIKYCGHEGTSNDKRTASLRKLLQAVIDCLQNSHKHTNWHNAEVTVYDLDDNSFKIISGQGKHQFVVSDGDNGEPKIVNTSNKVTKTRQVRVPQRSEYQQDIRPYSRTHGRGEHQQDIRPSSRTHGRGEHQQDIRPSSRTHGGGEHQQDIRPSSRTHGRGEHQQNIRPSSRTHGGGEQQWDSRPSSKTHAGFESTQPYRHTTHDVNSGHYFGHKTDEKKDCIIC